VGRIAGEGDGGGEETEPVSDAGASGSHAISPAAGALVAGEHETSAITAKKPAQRITTSRAVTPG
jgi:hypothetical protein